MPDTPNQPKITAALVLGAISILAPIAVSIRLAWTQSIATERALSETYAHDLLRRLEETASQFAHGLTQVSSSGNAPCSAQDIEQLRHIDFGSSYIKAAGRVAGDTLLCTSQGSTGSVPLGKPTLVSAHGVAEYYHVKLSPQQWHPLDVFAAHGFAIIVDPTLTIDIPTEGSDVELVAFVPSAPQSKPLAAVGQNLRPTWFQPIVKGDEASLLENGYLVTRLRSSHWDLAVVAATPDHYIYRRANHFILIFVPIGIACGALLAWAVYHLARIRSSFPAQIRSAARRKDFYLEYQPVVDLESRRIVGAEALVRWRNNTADIRPDYFISMAEENGLIHLITQQVVSIVAIDLPRFLQVDPHFRIAINMAAADLRDPIATETLEQLLHTSGARPENIEIEATERAFLKGPETAELIASLRHKGFRVAIDDFGTGYSSLACLQSLALDTLKIDRSFVETIGTDGATSQVVLHIIEMAHALQLGMIAEGVETEVQAQFLTDRGVRYAQGWLFGSPMPINSLLEQLHAAPVPAAAPVR